MTCEELLGLLHEDGEVTSADALEHLASCPQCTLAVNRWRLVRRELAALGEEEAPPFLHARIMAHLRHDGAGARRRWLAGWRLPAAASLAALALVAVIAGLGWWSREPGAGLVAAKMENGTEVGQEEGRPLDQGTARVLAGRSGSAGKKDRAPSAPAPMEKRQETTRPGGPVGSPTAELPSTPTPVAHDQAVREPPGLGEVDARPEAAAHADAAAESSEQSRRAAPRTAIRHPGARGEKARLTAVPPAPMVALTDGVAPAVACLLTSPEGEVLVRLVLPATAAPAQGRRWLVTVASGGRVILMAEDGELEPAGDAGALVEELDLAAGDYLLLREPPVSDQPR